MRNLKLSPEEYKNSTKAKNTWRNTRLKILLTKRNQLFQKWLDKPCKAKRNQYEKNRSRVTKKIRDAERENDFKLLGDNPSADKIYHKLKIPRAKSQPSSKTPDNNTLNEHFTNIGPT